MNWIKCVSVTRKGSQMPSELELKSKICRSLDLRQKALFSPSILVWIKFKSRNSSSKYVIDATFASYRPEETHRPVLHAELRTLNSSSIIVSEIFFIFVFREFLHTISTGSFFKTLCRESRTYSIIHAHNTHIHAHTCHRIEQRKAMAKAYRLRTHILASHIWFRGARWAICVYALAHMNVCVLPSSTSCVRAHVWVCVCAVCEYHPPSEWIHKF